MQVAAFAEKPLTGLSAGRGCEELFDALVLLRYVATCYTALQRVVLCRTPFAVYEQLVDALVLPSGSNSKDVVQCLCINKGKCTVSAQLEKNFYYPGDTARVRIPLLANANPNS